MIQPAVIQVHVEEEVKRKADALFAELGIDTQTAIRIFLNQSIRLEGIPFEVAKPKPNAETLVAMLEGMEIHPKTYNSFREVIDEIREELRLEEADEVPS